MNDSIRRRNAVVLQDQRSRACGKARWDKSLVEAKYESNEPVSFLTCFWGGIIFILGMLTADYHFAYPFGFLDFHDAKHTLISVAIPLGWFAFICFGTLAWCRGWEWLSNRRKARGLARIDLALELRLAEIEQDMQERLCQDIDSAVSNFKAAHTVYTENQPLFKPITNYLREKLSHSMAMALDNDDFYLDSDVTSQTLVRFSNDAVEILHRLDDGSFCTFESYSLYMVTRPNLKRQTPHYFAFIESLFESVADSLKAENRQARLQWEMDTNDVISLRYTIPNPILEKARAELEARDI